MGGGGWCRLPRALQFEPGTQRYSRTANVCIWVGVGGGRKRVQHFILLQCASLHFGGGRGADEGIGYL